MLHKNKTTGHSACPDAGRERSEGSVFYDEESPSLTKKIPTGAAVRQGTPSAVPKKKALRPISFRAAFSREPS
jgi:hypothetical protein